VKGFAWAGAVLFFVSLAYFLFVYGTTFGVPAASGDAARALTWNVIAFSFFALHHSLFARERVRAWVARTVPAGLERSVYVWIASLLFIAVCATWQPVPGVAWQADGVWLWVLRALQLAGVWLTLRSAAVLDIFELSGVRQAGGASGASRASEMGPTEFKTSGPYGWVRHPIYSGWFLLVFAASPMTMTRLVFAAVSGVYLLLAIPFEERSMRAAAREAYDRYAARVRWRLIPRFW
jgi:methanethiol S-methyltransferase